ncbi:MAG: hypothetical protein J1E36_00840 [Eubacterium sp.]|nr:hypothetical protein [Eubacterium sp.]
METVAVVLNVLKIILGILLLIASVNLISIIKSNRDKKVENIADKMNKNLIAVAVLAIAQAVLCAVGIIMK